jgi:octaprenyl-diphosphate synthase
MAHCDDATRATLRRAIETGGGGNLDEVLAAIESAGSIQYTARLAALEADKARQALAILPESPYRQALTAVADFAVARKF